MPDHQPYDAPTKIGTCCYCGGQSVFTLTGVEQQDLSCLRCGAPLRTMKPIKIAPQAVPKPAPKPKRQPEPKPKPKPKTKTKTKPQPKTTERRKASKRPDPPRRKRSKTHEKRRRRPSTFFGGVRSVSRRLMDALEDVADLLEDVID